MVETRVNRTLSKHAEREFLLGADKNEKPEWLFESLLHRRFIQEKKNVEFEDVCASDPR